MHAKLTSEIIDAEPIPDKPKELRDATQRGLVLRIQPGTGLRTWYCEYRHAGRKTRVKLGVYPKMPVTRAREEAAKKRGHVAEGKDPGATSRAARSTGTLAALIDAYEEGPALEMKSGKITVQRLRYAFEPLLKKRAALLSAKDFDSWRTWRSTTRVKGSSGPAGAKSRNQDLRMLRAALQWAVDTGRIPANPLAELKLKREKERERPPLRALTDAEETAVLSALDPGDPFHSLIVVSLDTGARRAELLTLDWTEATGDAITVLDGKAKSGKRRTLPLTPRAKSALEAMQALGDGSGRVWRMSPAEVFRRWTAVCEAAGIVNRPRWHDLRATFATRLHRAGVPMNAVMALLGHSSLSITEKYLRLDNNDLTGAIATLANREIGR